MIILFGVSNKKTLIELYFRQFICLFLQKSLSKYIEIMLHIPSICIFIVCCQNAPIRFIQLRFATLCIKNCISVLGEHCSRNTKMIINLKFMEAGGLARSGTSSESLISHSQMWCRFDSWLSQLLLMLISTSQLLAGYQTRLNETFNPDVANHITALGHIP